MDYADVNEIHEAKIAKISVDRSGGCLISLRKGGEIKASSPQDADRRLRRKRKG